MVNAVMGQLLCGQTASTQLILTPFADVISSHLSSKAVERKVRPFEGLLHDQTKVLGHSWFP